MCFVNKVLLEHGHIYSFDVINNHFLPTMAEFSSCDRYSLAHKV